VRGDHAPAIGRALDVKCPRCGARENEPCCDGEVEIAGDKAVYREPSRTAPHVERGRVARWQKIGDVVSD